MIVQLKQCYVNNQPPHLNEMLNQNARVSEITINDILVLLMQVHVSNVVSLIKIPISKSY